MLYIFAPLHVQNIISVKHAYYRYYASPLQSAVVQPRNVLPSGTSREL